MRNKILTKFLILLMGLFLFTTIIPAQFKANPIKKGPDLQIKIICPNPAKAYAGQSLGKSIKVWVKNVGDVPAQNFSVDLVLSKDTNIPVKFAVYSPNFSDDVLLKGGREFVKLLGPGKTIPVSLNGTNTIPSDTPPGVYYLGAVVDPGKKVKEFNEGNNTAICRLIIYKQGEEIAFKVTKVYATVSPKSYKGKCPFKFNFTGYITTNGKGTVKYKWIRKDGAIAPVKTIYFAKSETKKVTTSWYLGGAGKIYKNYWEAVQILSPNSITSNKALFSLYCIGGTGPQVKLPDLIVKNIKLVNDCKIAVTVANIGNTGVPADKYVLPKAVGIQMYNGSKPWGGLILKGFDPAGKLKNPGGVATYIWFPGAANLNLKPGWNTIKVIADNNKNLTELREDNNILTKRVYCKKTADTAEIKAPKRFFLDFNDAYLVYQPSTKILQIASQSNVLSYGSDWQKAKVHSYLYDLKEKFWKGFYWRVNTSRKEVYRYHGPNFGKIGDSKHEKLTDVTVDVVGNINNPTRFFLRFKTAYLVYVPKTKTLQVTTEGNVLSYGSDWQRCNLKSFLYHLKQNVWKGFYWKVNTSRKQVYRITGGTFCKISPGSSAVLNIGVRVVE